MGGDREKEGGGRGEKERERGKKKRDEPRSSGRRLSRRNERWGYPGTYDSTERAVKKAVALKASSVEEREMLWGEREEEREGEEEI